MTPGAREWWGTFVVFLVLLACSAWIGVHFVAAIKGGAG